MIILPIFSVLAIFYVSCINAFYSTIGGENERLATYSCNSLYIFISFSYFFGLISLIFFLTYRFKISFLLDYFIIHQKMGKSLFIFLLKTLPFTYEWSATWSKAETCNF